MIIAKNRDPSEDNELKVIQLCDNERKSCYWEPCIKPAKRLSAKIKSYQIVSILFMKATQLSLFLNFIVYFKKQGFFVCGIEDLNTG